MQANPANKRKRMISEEEMKDFRDLINNFPPEAQEYISDLSSFFVEPDVYKKYKNSPAELSQIADIMTSQGISRPDIKLVMQFFGLPYPKRR